MNALRNRVQLIGHLGMDPDVRVFGENKKMAKLSIATNDFYTNNNGERIQETQWHTLVMWGRIAQIAEKFLKKGQEVAIEGKLVSRNYETKDGQKRFATEVIVSELVMLGHKEAA